MEIDIFINMSALLLQQGKLFILLKVRFLNSFSLSHSIFLLQQFRSLSRICVCCSWRGLREQKRGLEKRGKRKGRADSFPSTIPITPNCPASRTNSQMPCGAALCFPKALQDWCAAHSSLCLRVLAGLREFKLAIWVWAIRASGLSSSVTTGKDRAGRQ